MNLKKRNAKIIQLHQQGVATGDIAKQMDASESIVKRVIAQHGRENAQKERSESNLAEIRKYQNKAGFKVTMLEDEPSKPAKKVVEKPAEKKSKPKKEESSEVEVYTKDQLKPMKKRALVDIAAELGVFLDGSEKKAEMILAILEEQEKKED